jgi:hypothetical protein
MNKPRYAPQHAVDLQLASDVQVAPDGSTVAFVVAPIGHEETIPTSQIWLANPDGTKEQHRDEEGGCPNGIIERWLLDGGVPIVSGDPARTRSGRAPVPSRTPSAPR